VRIAEHVHVVRGGRARGTDEDATHHEVERLVDTAVAEATVGLLHKMREELGQHDRAVVGTDPTIRALQQAQVEVLLVHDDPDDERTAWFGEEATAIGSTQQALDEVQPGSTDDASRRQARLVDVAIRAVIGTGAEIRVVPSVETLSDGLGALLRWSVGS
jgi:peptide subunit release factor 1 (eRF1)